MKPIQLTLAALFAPGVFAEDAWVRDCDFISFGTAGMEPWLHYNCESPCAAAPELLPPRVDRPTRIASVFHSKSCEDCSHASGGGVLTCQGHDGEGGLEETSTNVDTAIKPIGASRIGLLWCAAMDLLRSLSDFVPDALLSHEAGSKPLHDNV
ncbi:hypothetical protein C8034_v004079 [Colletotrichum sidae]|uniref:Cyanovirin-N domain-containing protein n=1 Tax=Colletotrichum sidae TaxID=1347389 RepID=A0A4R8T8N8_9PEZI|nr:hypothetical protein C8034_v004079 [Colletotrichum sidae]